MRAIYERFVDASAVFFSAIVLSLLFTAGSRADDASRSAFNGLLRYRVPTGWREDKSPLTSGPKTIEYWMNQRGKYFRITIEMGEGDPERSEAVAGLKKAPWDAAVPTPAAEYDQTSVSGIETKLWRRRSSSQYRMEPGAAIPYFTDEFCTVALDGRFLLFQLSIEEWRPFEDEDAAERAWRSFLDSIVLSPAVGRSAVWSVFNRDGKEVLRIQDAPGPLFSTALPAAGTTPARHPFLSGTALDAAEEGRLRDILDHSASFADYVNKLKKKGYRVQAPH